MNSKLTCKYCNQIYLEPILLTCCGDNLCRKHINELTSNKCSNKFSCPLCGDEIPNYQVNKLIQRFLEIELHKFEIDPKFEKTLNKLKKEILDLEKTLKDPDSVIYEQISELKRQVDLDRETSKSQIDELADDLIKKLESYEKQFREDYKAYIDFKCYNDLFESSKAQLNEYEKCLKMFSVGYKQRVEARNETEKAIDILQPSLNELKKKIAF